MGHTIYNLYDSVHLIKMLEITLSIQSALFPHLSSSMNLKITSMLMPVESHSTYYTMFMRKMKPSKSLADFVCSGISYYSILT